MPVLLIRRQVRDWAILTSGCEDSLPLKYPKLFILSLSFLCVSLSCLCASVSLCF